MAFERVKYEAEDGKIHVLRMTGKVALVANNAQPVAGVNSAIKVKLSKNNREFGIRPRFATIYRVVSATGATGTVSKPVYARIPILTKTEFASVNWANEAQVNYDGEVWKVLSRSPEDY